MWTKSDEADVIDPGIALLISKPNGEFICNVQYSGHNEGQISKSNGFWKTWNIDFYSPDEGLWSKWEEDHTHYWVENIYGNNYYYSGKIQDGKLVGAYVSDSGNISPGTFSFNTELDVV